MHSQTDFKSLSNAFDAAAAAHRLRISSGFNLNQHEMLMHIYTLNYAGFQRTEVSIWAYRLVRNPITGCYAVQRGRQHYAAFITIQLNVATLSKRTGRICT